MNVHSNLSQIERFSLTLKLTEGVVSFSNKNFLCSLASRIVGAVSVPFAALTDLVIHAGLFVAKAITGVVVSPYNLVFSKHKITKELELSSALIHLIRAVESVFTAFLLPLVFLLSPTRAHSFIQNRQKVQKNLLSKEKEILENEINRLKADLEKSSLNLQGMTDEVKKKRAELDKEVKAKGSLQDKINKLKEKLQRRKTTLQDKEKAHREELNAQTAINRNDKARLDSFERNIDTNESAYKSMKDEIQQHQAKIQELKLALQEKEVSLQKMSEAIEKDDSKERLVGEAKQLNQKLEQLTSQLQEKEKAYDAKQHELNEQIEVNRKQDYKLGSLTKNEVEKAEEFAAIKGEVEELKKGLKAKQAELAGQKVKEVKQIEEIAAKKRVIEELQKALDEKEASLKEAAEKFEKEIRLSQAKYEGDNKELNEKLAQVSSELKARQEELKRASESNKKQRDESISQLVSLTSQLEQYKARIGKLEADLEKSERSLQEAKARDEATPEAKKEQSERKISELEARLGALQDGVENELKTSTAFSSVGEEFVEIDEEKEKDGDVEPLAGLPVDKSIADPLNNGKVKQVWVKTNRDQSYVYYTGLSKAAEKELQEEVQITNEIRKRLKEKFPETEEFHLAINLDVVEGDKRINNPATDTPMFTVQCKRADIDLEKFFYKKRFKALSLAKKFEIAGQALTGLKYLHDADYVQGDLKPENMLVFNTKDNENIIVRTADFGKAIVVKSEGAIPAMKGNPRFSPPENETTKKGEVYSAALIVIKILEEAVLEDKTTLLEVKKPKDTPMKKRRGVEKYVVEHPDCYQCDQWVSTQGAYKTVANWFSRNEKSAMKAEKALHAYIDAFGQALSKKAAADEVENLMALLKQMTRSDSTKRPTMEEAEQEYNTIVSRIIPNLEV